MTDDLIASLRALAARVAASHGLELFDLSFRRESTGIVLRVMIDRIPPDAGSARGPREDSEAPSAAARASGGGAPLAINDAESVTIEDCQRVSHDLSALLDV